jgi:predicted SnoaL-like aldol condensation-catalyzing enzyme
MGSPAASPAITPEARNAAAVWTFFDQLFNKGNTSIVSVLGPNYKYNGSSQNNQAFTNWVLALRKLYSDMNVTFVTSVAQGNAVAVRWHMTGSHDGGTAADQWSVDAYGNNVFTFDDQGQCLTNDEAGSCTLQRDGVVITHDANQIFSLLMPAN